MRMLKDEWVRAAMTDDNVVVEFLVRLKQTMAAPPSPKSAVVALKWGIRQPRSKASMSIRCVDSKGDGDSNISTRRSPTTPLSWSGGGGSAASPSAAEGSEETSRQVFRSTPAAPSRSKGTTVANETASTTSKRSRKKKTFTELKEEENLLLKEKANLKKEIESIRVTFKEQKVMNEKLKRIKLDLNSITAKNASLIVDQQCQRVHSSSTLPSHTFDDKAVLDSCNEGKALLFDLNMMPVEDDFSTS